MTGDVTRDVISGKFSLLHQPKVQNIKIMKDAPGAPSWQKEGKNHMI
jgi:hypothetical protein